MLHNTSGMGQSRYRKMIAWKPLALSSASKTLACLSYACFRFNGKRGAEFKLDNRIVDGNGDTNHKSGKEMRFTP